MSIERYSTTAIVLHWLMFALLIGSFGVGVSMVDLPLSPLKLKYYSWHKWIGVTVFLLALVRVAWRLTHPVPPMPAGMPAWQRRAADATHRVLYGLLIVIPLTGWMYSSAAGVPTVYLGLVQLPDLVARDQDLAEFLKRTHLALNFTLLALVAVHAVAAVKHHFIDRDDVLARMLPLVKPKS